MAIYFYLATIQTRDLMYRPFWDTWLVYRPDSSSKLKLVYSGSQLERHVFIKQIAIWNEGYQSIRRDDVLAPVVLVTNSTVKILDASLVAVTRELTHFKIDASDLDSGRIPISWEILEHKDGALVQIICAVEEASKPLSITLEGAVEGQKTIRTASRAQLGDSLVMEVATLCFSVMMFLGGCGGLVLGFNKYAHPNRKRIFAMSSVLFAVSILWGWLAFNSVFDWPPFQMQDVKPKNNLDLFMGCWEPSLLQRLQS